MARREPREAQQYINTHAADWSLVAAASPADAADILEAVGEEAAGELIAELEPDQAAELFEEVRDQLAAAILGELQKPVRSRSWRRWRPTRPPMSWPRSTRW